MKNFIVEKFPYSHKHTGAAKNKTDDAARERCRP